MKAYQDDTTITDVAELERLREAEARLNVTERQFRLAMETAPIGIALVGLDGSWLAVNDRVCDTFGRTAEDLTTRTLQDLTHPDDLDADLALVDSLLAGEIDHHALERRYLHADGHVVHAQLHRSLVRDDDGSPVCFITHIVDISEQTRTEAELRASNADLERFAAAASHDLRGPLATTLGLLDLLELQHGEELSDDARELVERARRNTLRLNESVGALLQLAHVSQRALTPETVDLATVLAEVVEDLTADIDASAAAIELAAEVALHGDRPQLRLLFQNLVANAVKFRAEGRPLHVRVAATALGDGWIEVVVDDNGRGFDPRMGERIFEPFIRTREGETPGHGIGLATCRRIVERHGGTITAEVLDPGARFRVRLPGSS